MLRSKNESYVMNFLDDVAFFCRTVILTVFLIAVIGKLSGFSNFVQVIEKLNVLPAGVGYYAGLLVLISEAFVVALLLPNVQAAQVFGFVLAVCLLLMFCFVQARMFVMGDMSCNCFGKDERDISWQDVLRNALLLFFALLGLLSLTIHGYGAARMTSGLVLIFGVLIALIITRLSFNPKSLLRTGREQNL